MSVAKFDDVVQRTTSRSRQVPRPLFFLFIRREHMSPGAWCLLLCCAVVNALPFEQQPFQLRRPLPALASAERVSALAQFHPWHHWSGISPHFAPAPYAEAPPECNVDLAIYLTRHGAIYAKYASREQGHLA